MDIKIVFLNNLWRAFDKNNRCIASGILIDKKASYFNLNGEKFVEILGFNPDFILQKVNQQIK